MDSQSAGRDPNNGRFTPGNPGGPGRPRREKEAAILAAISDALSPAEITKALRDALDIATETRSARGIIAVLELAAGYGIGKPVQRTERTEGDPISAAIAEMKQAYYEAHQEALQAQSTPGSE